METGTYLAAVSSVALGLVRLAVAKMIFPPPPPLPPPPSPPLVAIPLAAAATVAAVEDDASANAAMAVAVLWGAGATPVLLVRGGRFAPGPTTTVEGDTVKRSAATAFRMASKRGPLALEARSSAVKAPKSSLHAPIAPAGVTCESLCPVLHACPLPSLKRPPLTVTVTIPNPQVHSWVWLLRRRTGWREYTKHGRLLGDQVSRVKGMKAKLTGVSFCSA